MISKFFIPGLLIIGAVALFFGMTEPLRVQISEVEAINARLVEAETNASELKRIGDDLKASYYKVPEENRTKLEQLLPSSVDNVKLIIDINKIATDYGMPLRNIKVHTDDASLGGKLGPQAKKYGTVTLGFTVAGTYRSLRSFLEQLETSLRLVDTQSLNFTASDKDSNEYSFEVKTYWLKPTN